LESLERSKAVKIQYIPPPPLFIQTLRPFIISGPLKVLFQLFFLFRILLAQPAKAAEFILVQNPPSIPTLFVARVVAFVRGTKLVVDWHNTGYSILAMKLGPRHMLVRIARWYVLSSCAFLYGRG
jgi:beta-1,4-mannosyltransferase